MWFVYAMSASVIWGVSYAASGRAIERGGSPVTFFFLYSVAGAALGWRAGGDTPAGVFAVFQIR